MIALNIYFTHIWKKQQQAKNGKIYDIKDLDNKVKEQIKSSLFF